MSLVHRICAENANLSPKVIGNKGLSLCKMMTLGLNVPHGFIFSTELFRCFEHNQTLPAVFESDLRFAIKNLELDTGQIFGGLDNPLLVSVRSGAAASMPGMMDSFLNIGMRYDALKTPADDALYIALIYGYASLIHEVYLDEEADMNLTGRDLVHEYLRLYHEHTGIEFPQDPFVQIKNAMIAVLKSVHNRRAKTYRMLNNISADDMATAVIIQKMVIGNTGNHQTFSGSGVANSRNPNTGHSPVMGEFMRNHQGDMIVGGRIIPDNLNVIQKYNPVLHNDLCDKLLKLERLFLFPVEVEFTIENNILWFLQVRKVKISDEALIYFAVEQADCQNISGDDALMLVKPRMIERFLHASVDDDHHHVILDTGVAASPGAASGHAVFTADDAVRYHAEGKKAILIRHETSPEDIYGMFSAAAILTARGGMTSHAAVAARGMGRPCVTGVNKIKISVSDGTLTAGERVIKTGDMITVNGTTGDILWGAVKIKPPEPPESFYQFNTMASQRSRMNIRTNIDSLDEADLALYFQTSGIGLYRTEYALYKESDIQNIRKMVLAQTVAQRELIAADMQNAQILHFRRLFEKMNNLPVTVRLLDPPLHEFFSDTAENYADIAEKMNMTVSDLTQRLRDLKEFNPMLGVRGCRVGILYPEIYRFQTLFILTAAMQVGQNTGIYPDVEIMIPFVGFESEFKTIKDNILSVYQDILSQDSDMPRPKIGAMIEIPRAALCADKIAQNADFLSFGTNDLTQTVLGISRDDSPRFMQYYMRKKLVDFDPFVTLDIDGVGMLIAIAVKKAREANPNIIIGLCGEHGADPECVDFCEMIGIDYLSCSAYRMASARLAAAQSSIKAGT